MPKSKNVPFAVLWIVQLRIVQSRYLLPWDLISSLLSLSIIELKPRKRLIVSNQLFVKSVILSKLFTNVNYIQQFAEISENTLWDILMGHIIRKRLSRACQPEADCRHLYWIIDFTGSFYTDVSSVSFLVSTSRPSSIMYNIVRYPYWQPEPGIIVALRINLSCQQWRLSL